MIRQPIDLPPIVSVELIQITDTTNIPFAAKATETLEKIKKKEEEKKLVSKQAPPSEKKKKNLHQIMFPLLLILFRNLYFYLLLHKFLYQFYF